MKTSNMLQVKSFSSVSTLCSPDCPICYGLGFYRVDCEINDPQFGKLMDCPCVDPFVLNGKECGINEKDYQKCWKNIVPINNIQDAVSKLRKVQKAGSGWVYIYGSYGLGKSTLLQTMVAECIRSKRKAKYTSMAMILDDIRSTFSYQNPIGEFERKMDYYYNVDVLCIDEFNRVNRTEFADEKIHAIMDNRYRSAINGDSITVIASNIQPNEYDPAISDRIYDNRFFIVKLFGDSARPNIPNMWSENVN